MRFFICDSLSITLRSENIRFDRPRGKRPTPPKAAAAIALSFRTTGSTPTDKPNRRCDCEVNSKMSAKVVASKSKKGRSGDAEENITRELGKAREKLEVFFCN